MGRKAETITARQVETITEPGRFKVENRDVYLRVTEAGTKNWLFRYTFGGKQCELGFGAYHKATNKLSDAQTKADRARGYLADGKDPKPYFQAERAKLAGRPVKNDPNKTFHTFKESAIELIAHKGGGWSAKHRSQWESTLETYVYPHIPALAIIATMRSNFIALKGRNPNADEYVFSAQRMNKPLSGTTMIARVKKLGYDATQHGTARSTFRDWAGNNGYDRQAIEFCLAHKLKDQTERAYFRSNLLEPRRKIMADWAVYLEAAPVAATEEQDEQAAA